MHPIKPRFNLAPDHHGPRQPRFNVRSAIMPRDPKPLRYAAFAAFTISITTLLGVLSALVIQVAA